MNNTIPISEIFGPTLQGEGFHVGYPTIFVRTGGCSYVNCSFCDTLYAVLPEFKHTWIPMTPTEIMRKVEILSNNNPCLITFSGGNPAMRDLGPVIDLANSKEYTTTIETQGDIPAYWFPKLDHLTLSPKPPSSLMKTDYEKLKECVTVMGDTRKTSMKIVVSDLRDYEYALDIFKRFPDCRKYISPCNISPGKPDLDAILEKTRWISDIVLKDGFYDITIIPQLHVLLWGNEKGR